MKHPTLPCLFALCCVLTINLAPGTATYNGLNTSCFVTGCTWKCACAHMLDTHAWGYMRLCAFYWCTLPTKNTCNLRSESGISIITRDLLMFNCFRSLRGKIFGTVFQFCSFKSLTFCMKTQNCTAQLWKTHSMQLWEAIWEFLTHALLWKTYNHTAAH